MRYSCDRTFTEDKIKFDFFDHLHELFHMYIECYKLRHQFRVSVLYFLFITQPQQAVTHTAVTLTGQTVSSSANRQHAGGNLKTFSGQVISSSADIVKKNPSESLASAVYLGYIQPSVVTAVFAPRTLSKRIWNPMFNHRYSVIFIREHQSVAFCPFVRCDQPSLKDYMWKLFYCFNISDDISD
ncbi:hypothetical protein JOB18_014538 [Solea senegalensis]|uniref:Uncharacterized protein n=1 Tax=Solea senegalensis TaxID=28829 RepID=A0AAV6QE38_SOLSE|nr:hypothetical protein JOB18_014538 [Solea senegalensis]